MFRRDSLPISRWSVSLFILHLFCCGISVDASNSNIVFSFANVSSLNEKTWDVNLRFDLTPYSELTVTIVDLPPASAYSIFHVHSYPTFVKALPLKSGTMMNGTDLGFVHYTKDGPGVFTISNPFGTQVNLLLVVVAYNKEYPVPGGCALEFPTKVAPYLIVEEADEIIKVKGQPASTSIDDTLCFGGSLEYEFYYLYTSDSIESPENHFDRIMILLDYSKMIESAYPASYMDGSPTQRIFARYPGVCTYFAMVVKGASGSAVYSPANSMLCAKDGWTHHSISMNILIGWLVPTGALLVFAGHSMFPLSIFLTSFLGAYTVSYVGAVTAGVPKDEAWNYAYLIAVVVACCLVGIMLCYFFPIFWICIPIGAASYLIICYIYYLTAGNIPQATSGPTYWGIIIAAVVLLASLLLMFPVVGCIASLCIIGVSLIMYAVDYFMGTRVSYAFINPIRRLTTTGFSSAITSPPLETADIGLMFLGVSLAVLGFLKQRGRAQGRAPFPPPPRVTNVLSRFRTADETRPLLSTQQPDPLVY